MKKILLFQLSFLGISGAIFAQATGFGIKAGPGLGFQRWNGGSKRDLLSIYHVDAFLDSESASGNIIYGQLGFHTRGSSSRIGPFEDVNGIYYPARRLKTVFSNVVLEIGAKKLVQTKRFETFYALGVRGEYTSKSKFEFYDELQDWVRKFNYGISIRMGAEWKWNKLTKYGIDLNIAPDISKQIYVPAGIRYYNPITKTTSPGYEQSVRNIAIELSFYIRFLQIIEYDE